LIAASAVIVAGVGGGEAVAAPVATAGSTAEATVMSYYDFHSANPKGASVSSRRYLLIEIEWVAHEGSDRNNCTARADKATTVIRRGREAIF